MRIWFVFIGIALALYSCSDRNKPLVSMYHWKSEAIYSKHIENAMDISGSEKIYLRYFDVELKSNEWSSRESPFPTYVINKIAPEFSDFEIVPVVYLTNNIFQLENLKVVELAKQVRELINQISLEHFKKEIKEIQIDCDWTQSTRMNYFEFLEILNTDFNIDATIRLHQVKFKDKTGIPPVKKGTLMMYNVGDLKNRDQNSILEHEIVGDYINSSSTYPISLNIGLPIYSQTIVFNNDDEVRIMKGVSRQLYETDSHFKKVSSQVFNVEKDTLFNGLYLSEGYQLKLEEVSTDEVLRSYSILKMSKLNLNGVVLYHLDDEVLTHFNISELIEGL